MVFDSHLDVGIVLALVAAAAGFSVFAFKLFSEIGKINLKLDLVWEWFMKNHQAPTPNGLAPSSRSTAITEHRQNA